MGRPHSRRRTEHERPDPWSGPYSPLVVASSAAAGTASVGLEHATSTTGDKRFRPTAHLGPPRPDGVPATAKTERTWPVRWCDFLTEAEGIAGVRIAGLFRALLAAVGTRDYHLRAVPCEDRGFRIDCLVAHGAEKRGPVAAGRCMSCDLDASLLAGLHGEVVLTRTGAEGGAESDGRPTADGEWADPSAGASGAAASAAKDLSSRDTLLHDDDDAGLHGVRVWLDAKARNMLIVTPSRHVESMEDMTDAELRDLWMGCVAVVEREALPADSILAMICNSGRMMNHSHLHVKIKVDGRAFGACRARWGASRQARWERLVAFAVDAARPALEDVLAKAPEGVKTVFVGELECADDAAGAAELHAKLRDMCEEFGAVTACRIIRPRSCAFVSFSSHAEAARCIVGLYRRSPVPASDRRPFFDWAKH
jgi:hypothetical protein